jgi:1,4-dihydroxy-2-naphthoyl-CoA hydrolase
MPDFDPKRVHQFEGTLIGHLGMQAEKLDPAEVIFTMPVDQRTVQRFGILHGGASVALAETVASVGATLHIDLNTHFAVGLEINANHIKSVSKGSVKAIGKPVHVGRSTQIWEIKIYNDEQKLCCISRCTMSVNAKRG